MDFYNEYKSSSFGTKTQIEIALYNYILKNVGYHPLVFDKIKYLDNNSRNFYESTTKINTKPTNKGIEEFQDNQHKYYGYHVNN